ncbi:MAG: glycosyltransferase family 4 protein [candidate division WOR-3 bacterium]
MTASRIKVLHIATAFPRHPGDVITPWLVKTLEKQREKGIEVEVFTSSYRGLKSQSLFGIKVHRFRYFFKRWEDLTHDENVPDRLNRSFRYKIILIFYLLFGLFAIYRLCRKEKFSIIQCHWPLPHSLFGYIGKKVCGAKLISSFYGAEMKLLKKNFLLKRFFRWLLSQSDAITAISNYGASLIREVLPDEKKRIVIVPFGAAIEVKKIKREEKNPIPQLLFVGRLVERKGVEYLIRAFAEVRKETPAFLTIIGDGKEREKLETLAKELGVGEAVRFTGFISSPELERYYEMCDIFILPAIFDAKGDTEMLGVVLLEAMSYQKPVIASGIGGITDIVKHQRTGILVKEKSVGELKEAILALLRDENLRREIGEAGYKFIQSQFSWERIIGDLSNLYQTLSAL